MKCCCLDLIDLRRTWEIVRGSGVLENWGEIEGYSEVDGLVRFAAAAAAVG